ncbi:MAG TPA: hypothetical protein DCL44_10195 [Elusimicrobia bacterium]|nr:hypothetical protein [Elusimicrobiota bacterium]
MKSTAAAVVFLLAFFCFIINAPALEITKLSSAAASAASPDKAAATPAAGMGVIVFSGVLEVKGISLRKNAVVMPVTEYKGRSYEDIKLLSKGLYAKIEACLSKSVCKNAPAALPKITVTGVKMLKSKNRLANSETVFDGELLVTAGIMNSSREPGELWISWPEDFKINDAALKAKAETLIKETYAKTLKTTGKS